MNKSQFLAELSRHMEVIPEKERSELIEDYVAHFQFGLQEGKTEEDIVRELGNPEEIALDAINEYKRTKPTFTITGHKKASPKTARTIFSIIGLTLLNLVCAVLPLFLSVWAAWVSVLLAFAIGTLSPLIAVVDFAINDYSSAGKLYLSLVMSGVSIFAVFGVLYSGKYLMKITASYYNWNVKIIKGAE